jgi:peptidoglycan/LPS O-acetylase OafA/YrhL
MRSTLARTADGLMPYFAVLDGMRAYCVLLVMFDHLKSHGHSLRWLNGHLGVDLFFIISGFLITTLLRREQSLRGEIDFASFYWRRFFRIVPVYVVVLLLYIAICQFPSQAEKWIELKDGLPWFLSFMNEYVKEPGNGNVFTHTWSLGVEEKFYLLWPVLFFIVGKTARSRRFIAAGLIIAVTLPTLLGHGHLAQAYFGLLMGCVLGIILSGPYAGRAFSLLRKLPPSVALAIFVCGFWAHNLSKDLTPGFSAAATIFVGSLLARKSWLSRAHSWAPLVWLGKRSYSMYLVHVLSLNAIEALIPINSDWLAAAALALSFALAAAVAEVLYRTVEQPARRLGREYLRRHNEIAAAV